MKYTRKDNKTNKFFFLFIMLIGITLIYLGLYQLRWFWNVLTLPIGFIMIISGFQNYRRTSNKIQEIEFTDDTIQIKFLNGNEKEIQNSQLSYSLLVKKLYKPIRSIELIEKKKNNYSRGKRIGIIDFVKWEKDIEPIARHLVSQNFERKKWKFGWGIGDLLMIFSIILGFTESTTANYIGTLTESLAEPIGDVGVVLSEGRNKKIGESKEAENKYLNK